MVANPAVRFTRWLLISSSIVGGVAAVGALFAPEELMTLAGAEPNVAMVSLVQFWAGALGGIAMMNWMSRENLLGGIYNRPLLIANLFHSVVVATTLLRVAASGAGAIPVAGSVIFTIFAAAFGSLLFRSPV